MKWRRRKEKKVTVEEKKNSASRTENNDISDNNYNEIEVEDESSEEEIEDNGLVVAMWNCWKGLSPSTAEEDVVISGMDAFICQREDRICLLEKP